MVQRFDIGYNPKQRDQYWRWGIPILQRFDIGYNPK